MRFFRISRANLAHWQSQLEALEQLSEYPLGADSFRLSHGADYFAFFERMGEVVYYGLEEGGKLVAVGCGILRPKEDGLPRRWYVSDIKVHPEFRGRHLMVKLFARAFFQNYLRCPRGYAVAMDPPDGRVPPSLRALQHFKWLPATATGYLRLNLYSADAAEMQRALPLLSTGEARPRFLSLRGAKDLMMQSTKTALPLLHLSFSSRPAPQVFEQPQSGYTHMWCLPQASSLSEHLHRHDFRPSATATVIYHRLSDFDGSAIETAEI